MLLRRSRISRIGAMIYIHTHDKKIKKWLKLNSNNAAVGFSCSPGMILAVPDRINRIQFRCLSCRVQGRQKANQQSRGNNRGNI